MNLNEHNKQILKDIKHIQNLKELEDYINSEKFKNIAIEIQIDRIRNQYDIKYQKEYIKKIKEQTLLIQKNLHFYIDNFILKNKSNINFSSKILTEEEKKEIQNTYVGKIKIILDKPLTYNDINPTFLFEDTIFKTGSGGGGNISQYEFNFLEKHIPKLSNQFLFDFKKNNSLLAYRKYDSYENIHDEKAIYLLSENLNKNDNKVNLLNKFENIFDTHFNDNDENNIKAVNIIFNVINIHSCFIKSFKDSINEKYIKYLKNAKSFINNEDNLKKIIDYNLDDNEATQYENTKKIKETIKNLNRYCQLAIMKFASLNERIEIYNSILNSDNKINNSKNYINRNEAFKDNNFLDYCFNKDDNIPKYFLIGNIQENISYYIHSHMHNIDKNQKIKNEDFILNFFKKEPPSEKLVKSIMFNFFYSVENSKNIFELENKDLINFFINKYILIESNKPFIKNNVLNNNFLHLCNYINSFDNYKFEINGEDVSINMLFLLTNHKKNLEDFNINTNIDNMIEKTNQFISNKNLNKSNNKKLKI